MIRIKEIYGSSDQRIEITLTNGQALTLMVNESTGKVSILSDSPHVIGQTVDVVRRSIGTHEAIPTNVVFIEYYGYPSD